MQVTYTQGAPPNMFMKDADGNTVEEIGIANWKVEHIEEFRARTRRRLACPLGAASPGVAAPPPGSLRPDRSRARRLPPPWQSPRSSRPRRRKRGPIDGGWHT